MRASVATAVGCQSRVADADQSRSTDHAPLARADHLYSYGAAWRLSGGATIESACPAACGAAASGVSETVGASGTIVDGGVDLQRVNDRPAVTAAVYIREHLRH